MQKAEDIAGSQEWNEALGLPSQDSASNGLSAQDAQPSVFLPGPDVDPADHNEMDTFDWGFGILEDEWNNV